MKPKILFIVGSLRKGSFNKTLALEAEKYLSDKAEVTYLDYASIPFMNQDIENPVREDIQRIRDEVLSASALWIFSPEYNGDIPGPLKNVLDWLSRPMDPTRYGPSALKDKKVTASGVAGGSAASNVLERLKALLPRLRMSLVAEPFMGASLPKEAFTTGEYTPDEETKKRLFAQADALLKAL